MVKTENKRADKWKSLLVFGVSIKKKKDRSVKLLVQVQLYPDIEEAKEKFFFFGFKLKKKGDFHGCFFDQKRFFFEEKALKKLEHLIYKEK